VRLVVGMVGLARVVCSRMALELDHGELFLLNQVGHASRAHCRRNQVLLGLVVDRLHLPHVIVVGLHLVQEILALVC
jgi:hypothetical protein